MLRRILNSTSVRAMLSSTSAAEPEVATSPPRCRPLFLSPSDPSSLSLAARLLSRDLVVAVPTDTIYGIACLAQSSSAVRAVYDMKGRHEDKPLAICVGSGADVSRFCEVTVPGDVLEALFPGPVTLIFPRLPVLNPELNPGVPTVGVRVPDSDFILDLTRRVGQPLALTSANLSGQPSALRCDEFKALWPSLAAVVDAGVLPSGKASRSGSTVVDLSLEIDPISGFCARYKVVRDGCALDATREVLGRFGLAEMS